MARREKNDVFVIGDEQLDAETQTLQIPERETQTGDQEPGGPPPPGLGRPSAQSRPRSTRWLAALSIGAALAGAFATLELSSSGPSKRAQDDATSARSALVLRPAPNAAEAPAQAPPALPPRRDNQSGRPRHQKHDPAGEPEREPSSPTAPESSPAPTVPIPVAEPIPAPTPPSPPPPSSGGGPGGVERFGFER